VAKSLPRMTERTLEDIKATATGANGEKPADAKPVAATSQTRATARAGAEKNNGTGSVSAMTVDPVIQAALSRRAEEEGRSVEELLTESANPREPSDWRLRRAREIVSHYSVWNSVAGAVPLPSIDILLVGSVQLAMVRGLSKLYGVPFNRDLGKALILSTLGSVTPYMFSWNILGTVVRFASGTGLAAAMFSMSALSAASTYAMGRLFIQHFEAGGTLLTLDPRETKSYFKKLFLEEQQSLRKKHGRP
jgi:uncharacterized protein (DUF697 family)